MIVPPERDALAQHVLDLTRRAGIEPGERFVENDHLRLVNERAGERHFLPHALGKTFAAFVRMREKIEPVQQFMRARRGELRARCPKGRR